MRMHTLITFHLIVMATLSELSSETYYVSPEGEDFHTGLEPEKKDEQNGPFRSVNRALANAQSGDSIELRGGHYNEFIIITQKADQDNPIRISNYNEEKVILSNNTHRQSVFLFSQAEGITVDDLTLSDVSGSTAILTSSSKHITLNNLNIKGTKELSGFSTATFVASEDISLNHCTFENNEGPSLTLDRVNNAKIYNTTIEGNSGNQAIIISNCDTVHIEKSKVHNSKTPDPLFATNCFINQSNNVTIDACDFQNNEGIAIQSINTPFLAVQKSTFYRNKGISTISISGQSSTDALVSSNTFTDNTPSNLNEIPSNAHVLSVVQLNLSGPRAIISHNKIQNTSQADYTGYISSGNEASAILINGTSAVNIHQNSVFSYQFPGDIDLSHSFKSQHTLSYAEGGIKGTGIQLIRNEAYTSNHSTISENILYRLGQSGISIQSGNNNTIYNNEVSWCGQFGITLFSPLPSGGRNGSPRTHECTGNLIDKNHVFQNGWLHGGTSGIGLFNVGTEDGSFANVVRNNWVHNQQQGSYPQKGWDWFNDGNGIIFDTGSNGNIAYNNICQNNVGAGIASVKSSHNIILHNTVLSNGNLEHADPTQGPFNQPGIIVTDADSLDGDIPDQHIIMNNLVHNNKYMQILVSDGSGHTITHNLYQLGPLSENNNFTNNGLWVDRQEQSYIKSNSKQTPAFNGDFNKAILHYLALNKDSPGFKAGQDLNIFPSIEPWLRSDHAGNPRHTPSPSIGALSETPETAYDAWLNEPLSATDTQQRPASLLD